MSRFDITTHTISASHPREYPRATIPAGGCPPGLKLVVNQYVPRGYTPAPGDVSIIFCHANGFHKELYEAFFDELQQQLQQQQQQQQQQHQARAVRLRAIWAFDAAHQGASGVLNEAVLGDQPSWADEPRDVLHLANTFSHQLPHPIVGMGHSYGGHAIVRAAQMHPSLFSALVQIDPVIEEPEKLTDKVPAVASARRVDVWPSRADAEDYFRSRKFFKSWDPRVLDAHLKHGLRELPTHTYPLHTSGVTLTTPKPQEVYTYLRCVGEPGRETWEFHPAPAHTFRRLKELVPPVLYIVGAHSPISPPLANQRKLALTPIAEMTSVDGAGHLVPLEKPLETAKVVAPYLQKQCERWTREAELDRNTPRSLHLPKNFVKELSRL